MKKKPIFDEEVKKVLPKKPLVDTDTRFAKVVVSKEEAKNDYESHLVGLCHPTRNEKLIKSINRGSEKLSEYPEEAVIAKAKVTPTDQMLRISFWEEVKRCERNRVPFTEVKVWQDICSEGYWRKIVHEGEWKMAYILTPVRDRILLQKSIHQEGLTSLLKIANANPFVTRHGKTTLDPRVAKVIIDAWKLIDDRMYGQAVQRVQTENIKKPKLSAQEVENEIKRLKAEVSDSPLTIEMTPKK